MKATAKLHALGQSVGLDNITRVVPGDRPTNVILAERISSKLETETEPHLDHDSSINALIRRSRAMRMLDAGAKDAAQTARRRVSDGD